MTTKQKTWTDLLGPWNGNCMVNGRTISQVQVRAGKARHCILHTAETPELAQEIYNAWKKEKTACQLIFKRKEKEAKENKT